MAKNGLWLSMLACAALPAMAADPATIDWTKIPASSVMLFYPGQSSYEWLRSNDHGKGKGAKAVRDGGTCVKCHDGDERSMGESIVKGASSPLNYQGKNRKYSAEGFSQATQSLIGQLNTALTAFEEQAKAGTVRGPGTPAIALYDASGRQIGTGKGGGSGSGGAGALGALDGLLLAGLGLGRAHAGLWLADLLITAGAVMAGWEQLRPGKRRCP